MADKKQEAPTFVERWVTDQQEWQRTILTYLDSMIKNDDFVVHLGNAMRGSLLAGKPYPTAPPPGESTTETPADERLDQILFAIHQLQGQMQDVRMTLDEMRGVSKPAAVTAKPVAASPRPARTKRAKPVVTPAKSRKRRARG